MNVNVNTEIRSLRPQKYFKLAMVSRWAAFSGNTSLIATFSSFKYSLHKMTQSLYTVHTRHNTAAGTQCTTEHQSQAAPKKQWGITSWCLFLESLKKTSFIGLVTERRQDVGMLYAVTHTSAYWTSPVSVTHVIFFTARCDIAQVLCGMHALEVWASSSSARLPLCKISFLSRPPLLS